MYSYNGAFFDRYGNIIDDTPWAYIQRFWSDWQGRYSYIHYFADGEELPWVHFGTGHEIFIDIDGRIITFTNNEMQGQEYAHLIFANGRVELHFIARLDHDWQGSWQEWQDHHWKEWELTSDGHRIGVLLDSWMFHNPTIFGTDIPIKLLQPLEQH